LLARPFLERNGANFDHAPPLQPVIALLKERANTIAELADAAMLFYREPQPDASLLSTHLNDASKAALADYAQQCRTVDWNREALSGMLKGVLATHKLKMPQLAMPMRLVLTGQLQTPSIDAVVHLFGRDTVLARIEKHL
jgi:glutamyl-tRNA synthetase